MIIKILEGKFQGNKYRLDPELEELSIGATEKNAFTLEDYGVSRYHARIFKDNDVWLIEDCSSTNGTMVNKTFIEGSVKIKDGDYITIGTCTMQIFVTTEMTQDTYKISEPSEDTLRKSQFQFNFGDPEQPTALKPGVVIDDFKLEHLLGRGGMGEVWCACQMSIGRRVAIKVLFNFANTNENELRRFRHEISHLAKLDHPNIVRALASGECHGLNYLVMDFIPGFSLAKYVHNYKGLPEIEALTILRQMVSALRHAWRHHHIVHRDIKPENILESEPGVFKLTDFGISRSLDEAEDLEELPLGTPQFMSPEQIQAEPLDCRSDIYALGATLFFMLTDDFAFSAASEQLLLTQILTQDPPSVRYKKPHVSVHTDRLVRRMMSKKMKDRPISYDIIDEEILEILEKLTSK